MASHQRSRGTGSQIISWLSARAFMVLAAAVGVAATIPACGHGDEVGKPVSSFTTTSTTVSEPDSTGGTGASGKVTLKFKEGTGVRLEGGRFVSISHADLSPLQALLDRFPGIRIQRVFDRPEEDLAREKEQAEASSGRPQPDKNLYYYLLLPAGVDEGAIVAGLKSLDVVEDSYPAPKASPPPG